MTETESIGATEPNDDDDNKDEEVVGTHPLTPVKRTRGEILAAARAVKKEKAEAGAKYPPPPKKVALHPNELTHEEVWLRGLISAMQTLVVKHPSQIKQCIPFADEILREFSTKFVLRGSSANNHRF